MNNRFNSKNAKKGRLLIGRLLPGTDLLTGLVNLCKENQMQYGSIVTIIGSLQKARFIYAIPDYNAKIQIKYCDPVNIQGPLEFLSGQGIIGLSDNSEIKIHLHGLLSDKNMQVYGGHFIEGGNPVLATIEVVIQEFEDVRIVRTFDEETEFPLFKI